MSNKLKKKKIKNKIKKNKKRRTTRQKGQNHLNLGQHQQNLPQYTRTVYVNQPSQQLNPVGPDQSELINQVMHNNNFIKKNNLLLQNDLNNQVQEEKKEHPLDRAKEAFDARGGTVSNNLTNTVFRIPNEKIKKTKHKVEYLDDDGYDGESDLNKMVQPKKGNDLKAVITRQEDKIQEYNDDSNLEPVITPHITEAVNDIKKVQRFFKKSDAQILKERKAKEAKEDKGIENELHQQALKFEVNEQLKSRSSRHKKLATI